MKEIALPVTCTGKEILDCDNDHVADCVSEDIAAAICGFLNKHFIMLDGLKLAKNVMDKAELYESKLYFADYLKVQEVILKAEVL